MLPRARLGGLRVLQARSRGVRRPLEHEEAPSEAEGPDSGRVQTRPGRLIHFF